MSTSGNLVKTLMSGPLKMELLENVKNFSLPQRHILVNLHPTPLVLKEGPKLECYQSSIFVHVTIAEAARALLITLVGTAECGVLEYPYAAVCMNEWSTAESLFGEGFAGVPLWRSPQQKLEDGTVLNMWFAPRGTNCAIHNLHSFKELHTQVFGIGKMQKFSEAPMPCNAKNLFTNPKYLDSLFQEVYMVPGFTHEPFYTIQPDGSPVYPWHQYRADTDCIWLVMEMN